MYDDLHNSLIMNCTMTCIMTSMMNCMMTCTYIMAQCNMVLHNVTWYGSMLQGMTFIGYHISYGNQATDWHLFVFLEMLLHLKKFICYSVIQINYFCPEKNLPISAWFDKSIHPTTNPSTPIIKCVKLLMNETLNIFFLSLHIMSKT